MTEIEKSRIICVLICVAALTTITVAQKVKVGYDSSVDFSKYKSYAWAQSATPPTQPLLYATVVECIDHELSSKGLRQVNTNGDLTLVGAGGVEYGNNMSGWAPIITTFSGLPPGMNATMWIGAEGPSALMVSSVPQGTLALEFLDRSANKVIWTGTVSQKLDTEQTSESLDLLKNAIIKLLKKFPPRSR